MSIPYFFWHIKVVLNIKPNSTNANLIIVIERAMKNYIIFLDGGIIFSDKWNCYWKSVICMILVRVWGCEVRVVWRIGGWFYEEVLLSFWKLYKNNKTNIFCKQNVKWWYYSIFLEWVLENMSGYIYLYIKCNERLII